MGLFKKKQKVIRLASMAMGVAEDISCAKDEVFSAKMMGDGVAFTPLEEMVYAPCDATVAMVFPTKHAIGLQLENGVEVLLHFGIDTVALNGEGFEVFVAQGDVIKAGDLLWKADLSYIKEHAPSEAIMVIITAMPEGWTLEKQLGNKKKGELMLEIH